VNKKEVGEKIRLLPVVVGMAVVVRSGAVLFRSKHIHTRLVLQH